MDIDILLTTAKNRTTISPLRAVGKDERPEQQGFINSVVLAPPPKRRKSKQRKSKFDAALGNQAEHVATGDGDGAHSPSEATMSMEDGDGPPPSAKQVCPLGTSEQQSTASLIDHGFRSKAAVEPCGGSPATCHRRARTESFSEYAKLHDEQLKTCAGSLATRLRRWRTESFSEYTRIQDELPDSPQGPSAITHQHGHAVAQLPGIISQQSVHISTSSADPSPRSLTSLSVEEDLNVLSNLLRAASLENFAQKLVDDLGVRLHSDLVRVNVKDLCETGMTRGQAMELLDAAARHHFSSASLERLGAFTGADDIPEQWKPDGSAFLVGMRVDLMGLLGINDSTESFQVVFDLCLQWCDPLLRGMTSEVCLVDGHRLFGVLRVDGNGYVLEPGALRIPNRAVHHVESGLPGRLEWCPLKRLNFNVSGVAATDVSELGGTPTFRLLDGRYGKVEVFTKYVAKFKSHFKMADFPFDRHKMVFHITALPPDDILCLKDLKELCGDESKCRIASDGEHAEEWKVDFEQQKLHTFSVEHLENNVDGRRNGRYRGVVKLFLTRRPSFYVHNYVFVAFMLTLMSFGVFAVPIESVGERSGITVTFLLASVSLKHMMSSHLPRKPYTTKLEWYIMLTFVILCLPMVEQVLFVSMSTLCEPVSESYDCKSMVKTLDNQLGLSFAILWILLHIVYGLSFRPSLSLRPHLKLLKKKREEKEGKERKGTEERENLKTCFQHPKLRMAVPGLVVALLVVSIIVIDICFQLAGFFIILGLFTFVCVVSSMFCSFRCKPKWPNRSWDDLEYDAKSN